MLRLVLFAAFVATAIVANWLVQHYGVVPVGFGLEAPAAVYVAGAAFLLRDALHEVAGRLVVVAAIISGAALSYLVAPDFALWSGLAFLVSEFADFAVYSPLRRRRLVLAVVASSVVGALVDTAIFLGGTFDDLNRLAGGALDFGDLFAGQMVGKLWVTVAAVAVLVLVRSRAVLPRDA